MTDIAIEYVDHMGSDLFVANVARVSFAKWKEEFEVGKDDRLINYLANHAHSSPFRHTQISLRCKAPVFLARQLQKHQAGLSWNEVSRRYVDAGIEYFVPDSWRSRPVDGMKQGSGGELGDYNSLWQLGSIEEDYLAHMEEAVQFYDHLLDQGVAPEMARMVLPQSMMVDWIWTGNLFSFFHVYRLRAGHGAQLEAVDFANKLEQIVEPLFPNCWSALKGE